MGFKIGRVIDVKRNVVVNVPAEGDDFRKEKIVVGFRIMSNTEFLAKRRALVGAAQKEQRPIDLDLEFFKQHGISSIEGPEFDDGKAMTIDEALDIPFIRAAIEVDYNAVVQGVRRKN